MAVELPNSWLLLGQADGTEESGTGDAVNITTPNGKMVIASGAVSDVQIEVRGELNSGVYTNWVPLDTGLFTDEAARYVEGIDRGFQMRATSTGAVIVQVFK